MIEVRDLCRAYGATVALDRVSFDVPRGEVVGLLGPNGAGKTTCLRILTGFVPPGSGSARIDGLDVAGRSLQVRARLGYLPEGVPLYPELRVREYLRFRARIKRVPRRELAATVEREVERCELGQVRDRIVGQLSRGYRQRVGLADALLGEPPLLVLDEPTVGLDPNQIRATRALIGGLGGDHTVLLSTHILSEVEAACSRALILDGGRLVGGGPVDQLRRGAGGAVLVQVRPDAETGAEQVLQTLAGLEDARGAQLVREVGADDAAGVTVELRGEAAAQLGERAARLVLERGWSLLQLRRRRAPLEEVFARLTGDAGSHAGGEAEQRPGGDGDGDADSDGAVEPQPGGDGDGRADGGPEQRS